MLDYVLQRKLRLICYWQRDPDLWRLPYPEALVQRDSSFFQPLCSRIPKEYTRYLVKPLDATMDKGTKGVLERFFKYAFVGMSGVAWFLDKGCRNEADPGMEKPEIRRNPERESS